MEYIKRESYEIKDALDGDELPGIRRVGGLSDLDGKLFGENRYGREYRLVLFGSGHRVFVHARADRYYCRPLDAGAKGVEPLSFSGGRFHAGSFALWV